MARKGFFHPSTLISNRPTLSLIPKCGACGLFKTCKSPKMPVTGAGKRKILVVAEAPGEEEDKQNKQLVGNSGRELMKYLNRCGIDMRKDCWLTNALICRPPNNVIPEKKKLKWISYCQPNLIRTINELKPEIIIPLGGVAAQSLLSYTWRSEVKGITRWTGWNIPDQKLNAWICPTLHPSYLLRAKDPVADRMFYYNLKDATNHTSRPWDTIPNYQSEIDVVRKPSQAARYIRKIIRKGGPTTFDYETNMLKPDSEKARIVSCSICWKGKKTVAFPWHGEARDAAIEYLRSRVPKRGANIKFEQRWTRAVLGFNVRGWEWCATNGAHWYDNRRGITSVEFQAYVLLGFPPWDAKVAPYLESEGSNEPNQIEDIDLDDLLMYNGLDSLLEYKINEIQMSKLTGDWR